MRRPWHRPRCPVPGRPKWPGRTQWRRPRSSTRTYQPVHASSFSRLPSVRADQDCDYVLLRLEQSLVIHRALTDEFRHELELAPERKCPRWDNPWLFPHIGVLDRHLVLKVAVL